MRLRCRALLLDAGGVIVLPDRELVATALTEAGVVIEPAAVPAAHYRAVRRMDHDRHARARPDPYLRALCDALGVHERDQPAAVRALSVLADRRTSGVVLWREPAPGAAEAMVGFARAGIALLVVTNSDGHAAENLRDAGICQTGPGRGARVDEVIDSALVGSAKPDPAIFREAMRRAGIGPASAAHVGDMLSADVDGALAAGITPIHLDPSRSCRSPDHRHASSLAGVWRHVTAA